MELTEEQLEQDRAIKAKELQRFLQRIESAANVDHAQALIVALEESREKWGRSALRQVVKWKVESAIVDEARAEWAQTLLYFIGRPGVEVLDALRMWHKELLKAVLQEARNPSRSTSPMSNLVEAALATAAAGWLEDANWTIGFLDGTV